MSLECLFSTTHRLMLMLIQARRAGGCDSTSVECLFSLTPVHTDAHRRRMRFNVGGNLFSITPLPCYPRGTPPRSDPP